MQLGARRPAAAGGAAAARGARALAAPRPAAPLSAPPRRARVGLPAAPCAAAAAVRPLAPPAPHAGAPRGGHGKSGRARARARAAVAAAAPGAAGAAAPGASSAAGAAAAELLQLPSIVVPAPGGGDARWRVRPYNEKTDFWPVAELQVRRARRHAGPAARHAAAAGAASRAGPCRARRPAPVRAPAPPSTAQPQHCHAPRPQARCFHDRVPFAPLDGLAFTMFKAEVVDGLKSKAKCVDPATYAMLVVEAAPDDASDGLEGSGTLGTSSSLSSGGLDGAGSLGGDASSFSSGASTSSSGASASSSSGSGGLRSKYAGAAGSGGAARAPVIGIVELGLQEEGDNVRALQQAGVLAPGGSSSSSSAASGSGGAGGGARGSGGRGGGGPACVYLSSMAVAPTARRGGAARAMLRAAQWQAALWGQRHIALHVFSDNGPAVALYSSAGWQAVGRDPEWRRWLGGRVRSFMVKALPTREAVEADAGTPPEVAARLRELAEAAARPEGAAGSADAGANAGAEARAGGGGGDGSGAAEQAARAA
jgi:GNAT superfamily N-acetyltransferase